MKKPKAKRCQATCVLGRCTLPDGHPGLHVNGGDGWPGNQKKPAKKSAKRPPLRDGRKERLRYVAQNLVPYGPGQDTNIEQMLDFHDKIAKDFNTAWKGKDALEMNRIIRLQIGALILLLYNQMRDDKQVWMYVSGKFLLAKEFARN